ncbi:hypothetical protein MIMGU_mgv11b017560mg [Erythranthe guttata]|uniref:RING-type domain-containing protein n=1 Tax=Erythranthe guttata TaxID=4155 RepID=A0A022QC09_ERYGU|nr:hypothetical protein MIMGU_mgv11b017560mg [Erythranthe guttata]
MPDTFLTIFVFELPRNRVEDVADGLLMMEACGICMRASTIGAQITVLPQCGHSFHSHCIVRHLLADNDIKTNKKNSEKNIKKKQKKEVWSLGIEPDVNRTRNLLIWSQTRYHCATDPLVENIDVNP